MDANEYAELIREKARNVALLRITAAGDKAFLMSLQDEWERAHAVQIAAAKASETARAKAETELRQLAMGAYHVTGTAKWPGVEVTLVTEIDYDYNEALAWAKVNLPVVVVPEALNRKDFESIAKGVDEWHGPGTIYQEAQARIVGDLQKVLL